MGVSPVVRQGWDKLGRAKCQICPAGLELELNPKFVLFSGGRTNVGTARRRESYKCMQWRVSKLGNPRMSCFPFSNPRNNSQQTDIPTSQASQSLSFETRLTAEETHISHLILVEQLVSCTGYFAEMLGCMWLESGSCPCRLETKVIKLAWLEGPASLERNK